MTECSPISLFVILRSPIVTHLLLSQPSIENLGLNNSVKGPTPQKECNYVWDPQEYVKRANMCRTPQRFGTRSACTWWYSSENPKVGSSGFGIYIQRLDFRTSCIYHTFKRDYTDPVEGKHNIQADFEEPKSLKKVKTLMCL